MDAVSDAKALGAETNLGCAEMIGRYIERASFDHPIAVLDHARRAIVDTVGCMILGADHPDTHSVLNTVRDWGQGTSHVFGHDQPLAPPWAALVNGTSAHALDFDDWEDPGITHASAAILPAVLAVARPNDSMDAILDAWIIGIEVIMRIGEAVNMTHYELGWHTTNTLGAIGATAACARYTGLKWKAAQNAVAISTSMMGGFTSQFGTTAKPLHAGLAAKTGVLAAGLAANNATGQAGVLEQDAGFLSVMTKAAPDDLKATLGKLGVDYALLEFGLHIKKYPSCGVTHLIIEASETLRAKHGFATDDIDRVTACISDIAYAVLPYRVPANRTEALFSVPWCAAVALSEGAVDISSFDPETIKRADLKALAARISVTQHPRVPGLAFHPSQPDILTLHMANGDELTHSVAYPPGSPQRPLSNAELEAKFARCADRCLSETRAFRYAAKVLDKETALRVADLLL